MAPLTWQQHTQHRIGSFEDVGALRRAVAQMPASNLLRSGEAELVATELGTNLLKHAHADGYVLYRQTADGIEFVSVDTGPGMAASSRYDDALAMPPGRDGLTAGLGTIERIADECDVYSSATGTVVFARLGRGERQRGRWRHGGVNVPLGGDGPSGDAWAVSADRQLAALMVDGLGHGDQAAVAATVATEVFASEPVVDPVVFLGKVHDAMRGTRGAVVGLCVIDSDAGRLTFAGIGNISAQILCGGRKDHLVGSPGTLGTQLRMPGVRVRQYPWSPTSMLVMSTDGMRPEWSLSAYPGLSGHEPTVVSATLHRDFTRTSDDAAVLVVTESG